MATATFRFHGELEDFIARDRRGIAFDYACARAATIKHAIESLGVPHTEAGRLLVNSQQATLCGDSSNQAWGGGLNAGICPGNHDCATPV